MRKENSKIHFDENPLFPETTLFLGNGFDLSLGLQTKYTDFFKHTDDSGTKDFWPTHDVINEDDQLYNQLNSTSLGNFNTERTNRISEDFTWFDLEGELKRHATRKYPQGIQFVTGYQNSFALDKIYFEEIRKGLQDYLNFEVARWEKSDYIKAKSSAAYNLIYQVCVHAKADPNIITFNYTDIVHLMDKCGGSLTGDININPNKVQHVHGSLAEEHIILGINEDKEVPKEYDFLFKSWDDYYGSHKVIDTLRGSQIIFFFGLSFGSIDSVYFVDFFKFIIKGNYDKHKKHIVVCTNDEVSIREIYRQFFVMGISIMELKAHCDFHFLLTNPKNTEHPHKFEREKIALWMHEWNERTAGL